MRSFVSPETRGRGSVPFQGFIVAVRQDDQGALRSCRLEAEADAIVVATPSWDNQLLRG